MVERIIIALIQWHYRIVSCIQIIPTEMLKEQTEKKTMFTENNRHI